MIKAVIFDLWGTLANSVGGQDPQTMPYALFPEVKEVLSKLRAKGYKIGLISNSPPSCKESLVQLEIDQYFDSVVWSFDRSMQKPYPAIFKAALEELEVKPEEAMLIGDSLDYDVFGAEKVGIKGVHVLRQGKNQYDLSVRNLQEIFKILK